MKIHLILAFLTFSASSSFASTFAIPGGGGIGNGGGTIVCRDTDHSIKSVELLDYYEAEILRSMKIVIDKYPGTYKSKVQAIVNRIGQYSQLRRVLYSQWLSEFDDESMVLNDVQFNNIPDAMNIGVPTGCEFEQGAVQIIPSLPHDKRYYLNGEIWHAMDDNQKAGLILHEFAYREALSYGHTTSVLTRYFVSLISSSAFDSLGFDAFVQTLDIVHFELNDFSVADSKLTFVFDPKDLYRVSDSFNSPYSIPKIALTGRVVANVGECLDSACSVWKPMYTPTDRAEGYLNVCNFVSITDGFGNQVSNNQTKHLKFEHVGWASETRISVIHKNEHSCKGSGVCDSMSIFGTSYGADGIPSPVDYLVWEKDKFHSLEMIDFIDGKIQALVSSFLQVGDVYAYETKSNLGSAPFCTLEVDFENGILHHIEGNRASSASSCSYRVGIGNSLTVLLSNTSQDALGDQVEFDANGNYVSGGIQDRIGAGFNK